MPCTETLTCISYILCGCTLVIRHEQIRGLVVNCVLQYTLLHWNEFLLPVAKATEGLHSCTDREISSGGLVLHISYLLAQNPTEACFARIC